MKFPATVHVVFAVTFSFATVAACAQVSFFTPPSFAGTVGTGGDFFGNGLFVGDLNGDGNVDLLNGDGTVQLGRKDGTFTSGTSVTGTPLAIADFNGDGKLDILEQANNSLLVLIGNGDGAFQAPVSTVIGVTLQPILAADLNGDGKADVLGVFGNTLFVFLNNGNGTFGAAASYGLGVNPATAAASPTISVGDFNADGKIDVAVLVGQANTSVSELAVFVGNGDGSLQNAKTSTLALLYPASSTIADFNADGKIDLAIVAQDPVTMAYAVWILVGNGDATFQAPIKAFAFSGFVALATADLNGDGKPDLVLYSPPLVGIWLGKGDGSFSTPHYYMTATSTPTGSLSGFGIADFDHDGNMDVAAGNFVLFGRGDGTLEGQPTVALGSESALLLSAPADFNADGRPDLAIVTQSPAHGFLNTVNIVLSDGSGGLTRLNSYTLDQTTNVRSIGVADVNQDGKSDLVVIGDANDGSGTNNWVLLVLLGGGDGTFGAPALYSWGTTPAAGPAILADFDNDGKLDLALPQNNGFMAIMISNGDGTFKPPVYYFCPATVLLAADFNGDGNIDVVGGDSSALQTAILFGNGDGTFKAVTFPLGSFSAELTADLNNDGKPDLIGGTAASNNVQVLLGNGDGTFKSLSPWLLTAGGAPLIEFADLNGDKQLDAVVTMLSRQGASMFPQTGIYLGNGDGTFSSLFVPVLGSLENVGYTLPEIADMNQDGKPDLIFAEVSSASGVFVLANTTSATQGSIGLAIAPGASNSQTIQGGGSATYNLTIGGQGWTGQVALSCTGLPSKANCSFPSGATVQVQGGTASTLSAVIGTTGTITALLISNPSLSFWSFLALGLASIVTCPFAATGKRKRYSVSTATIFFLLTLCSCGGGSSPPPSGGGGGQIGTPSGTYTVTVNAASGSLSQSLPLVLTVK